MPFNKKGIPAKFDLRSTVIPYIAKHKLDFSASLFEQKVFYLQQFCVRNAKGYCYAKNNLVSVH